MVTQQEINAANGIPSTGTPSDFTQTLQDTLMKQSGMISSANTGIESAIQGAIGQTQKATTSTGAAITSSYDRQIGSLDTTQQNQLTAARERGVGINTSDVAYKAMATEADKNLKDLEQRKQELLLQNDAAGASKVADLMLQTSKMKIDAMQQTFSNLMGMANFGLQAQAGKRADAAQSFTEKAAIASIGLQYGIPVSEGDTMQTIVAKAAPFASKMQQADLATKLANVTKLNAEAGKLVRENATDAYIANPANLDAMTHAYLLQPDGAFAQTLAKNANSFSQVLNKAEKEQTATVDQIISSGKASGKTQEEVMADVQAQIPKLVNAPAAVKKVADAFKVDATIQTKHTLAGDVGYVAGGIANVGAGIGSYLGRPQGGSLFPFPGVK